MPVRIGIIGCGAIARRRHAPETLRNPKARLVALTDTKPGRAEETARLLAGDKHKIATFTDYRAMLKEAQLDAVIVATPNKYHAPQTIDALRAGCHVMVEKPMAATRKEAAAMLAAAKKARKFLMVGQNQRLMPPHVKAKQVLDSGVLGRPLVFRTSFHHGGPEFWSLDGLQSWFFKTDEAVMGVCGDLGVHKADLVRYLLGEEIVEVSGFLATLDKKDPRGRKIGLDDNAFITMRTRSGVLGTMTISWTNYGRMEDNTTIVFCEKGVIKIGMDPEYKVIVHHNNGKVDKHKTGAIATNTKQVDSGMTTMFVNAITTGRPPLIDGAEGYKSLDVIITAIEAAKSGKTLKVKGL